MKTLEKIYDSLPIWLAMTLYVVFYLLVSAIGLTLSYAIGKFCYELIF